MVPDSIEREVLIEANVERVWEVLTDPAHMPGWFSGATAEVELRPGGRLVFHWREHGTFHASIERLEPRHRFSYRWSLLPGEAPGAGNTTLVEFTLAAEGSGTRLRVLETGFRVLAGDDRSRARHLEENRRGWAAALAGIQGYASRLEAASGG